ncbi:MAG: chorismate-binding protein, partial [Candidatus Omnitrophota bacterium]
MKTLSISKLLNELKSQDNFVFLETKRATKKDNRSFLFKDPCKIICCQDSSTLEASISEIEALIKKGYYAAGYIAYEAGFCFEPALFSKIRPHGFPLLWFGIYKKPVIYNHKKTVFNDGYSNHNYVLNSEGFNVVKDEYVKAIDEIKKQIEGGYTYQVNYTFKEKFSFSGDVKDFYLGLRANQSVAYSSFLKASDRFVLSFSPELFFRRKNRFIEVMPMKGTAKRGRNLSEDKKNIDSLSQSFKNRSENVMIVDLLRNDLGKICVKDTVKTKSLFNVQAFESVLQMT